MLTKLAETRNPLRENFQSNGKPIDFVILEALVYNSQVEICKEVILAVSSRRCVIVNLISQSYNHCDSLLLDSTLQFG